MCVCVISEECVFRSGHRIFNDIYSHLKVVSNQICIDVSQCKLMRSFPAALRSRLIWSGLIWSGLVWSELRSDFLTVQLSDFCFNLTVNKKKKNCSQLMKKMDGADGANVP